jgi:hypothetical protein
MGYRESVETRARKSEAAKARWGKPPEVRELEYARLRERMRALVMQAGFAPWKRIVSRAVELREQRHTNDEIAALLRYEFGKAA